MANDRYGSSDEGGSTFKFAKLTGSKNYKSWERNMIFAMRSLGLYGFVDAEDPYLKPEAPTLEELKEMSRSDKRDYELDKNSYNLKNGSLAGRIGGMCEPTIQSLLNAKWDAKETWDFLKKRYSPTGWSHKWEVLNALEQIHYSDCKSASEYGDKFRTALKEVQDLSITMEESVTIKALNNLGSGFDTYLTIVNDKARKEDKLPDLDDLVKAVEEEESRQKSASLNFNRVGGNNTNNRGGRTTRGGTPRGGRGGGRGGSSNGSSGSTDPECIRCFTRHQPGRSNCPDKDERCGNTSCGKVGHKTANCTWPMGARHAEYLAKNPKPKKDDNASTPTTPRGHIGLVQVSINKVYSTHSSPNTWILDSGATHHCSGNRSLFPKHLKKVNDKANTASGETLNVGGLGNITIPLPNGDPIILQDIMYIPGLTVNLISTPKLYRRNWSIAFPSGRPAELYVASGQLVAVADMVNDLFVLRTTQSMVNTVAVVPKQVIPSVPIQEAFIFAFSKPTDDLDVWHRRLAHLSYRNVIANASKVVGMSVKGPVPDKLCEPCMKGRQQGEISRVPTTKPTVFVQKISVDIGGPLPTTARGNKIFILIKCQATGMMFWYAKKLKSEIFKVVTDFVTWVERQTGHKVKIIVSGGELQTNAFKTWFAETGIQWEPSAPYTPAQNGVVERAMYTVMAPVRSVMKDMRLPKGMWDLIGEAVVYIKNRTLTTSGGNGKHITPFEGGNGVPPDISNLRALGCRAYTHIPKTTNRHKLDDRSWKGIFVGYAGNNQWKIYNPRTRKVHITRDVRFDENYSYYDLDVAAPSDLDEYEDEPELGEFWASEDDFLFDLRSRRRDAPGGDSTPGGDATPPIPPTPESLPPRTAPGTAESDEEESFTEAPEEHRTDDHSTVSNSSDLNDSASVGGRQDSPLPDHPIPVKPIPPPRVTLPNEDYNFQGQVDDSEDELARDIPDPVPVPKRTRGKAPAPPPTDRTSRLKAGEIDRPDYKKANDVDIKRIKNTNKPKGSANVVNNVYKAKQVPKSHIHMVRALNALQSGESFGLGHISEPMSYREALKSPFWPEWKKSMEHEIASHIKNGTWELVVKPRGRLVITGRWVFKIKYGIDGRILRFKARWVVHGYKQKEGVDYNETWAGVVKSASFRTLFGIAAERRLRIQQMDIVTAFLYGLLDEDVYVSQPTGFIENPELVCHLLKALYGLKQAPRVWYGVLHAYLKELGFQYTESDHSVFVSKDKLYYIAVYVDDLLLFGPDTKIINSIKDKLKKRFEMTDLGDAQHYLGVEIIRENDSILLRQTTYLTKVLERFGMDKCSTVASPMEPGLANVLVPTKDGQQADEDTLYWYGSAVGSLMYAATMTRPDFCQPLSLLSRFCSNPDSTHMAALQRVFKYVKGTLSYGIGFEAGQEDFHGYSDADWAGNVEDRRSTGGYVFFVAGGAVSWASKRQDLVALSSCESEYYAMNEAGKEAKWLRNLLIELGHIDAVPAQIWADNQGAIALSKNPEFHKRTKHIDAKYHWIREAIEEELIQVDYVPTALMAADGFTKPLGPKAHAVFLTLLQVAY